MKHLGQKQNIVKKMIVSSLMVISVAFVVPFIIQMVQRPIGLWDYFTIWDVMGLSSESVYDNSAILPYVKTLFLGKSWIYRPFSMLFYYIYIRIFHGNFWVLIILKWAAKFFSLYLLYLFNRKLQGSLEAYFFVFTFLLFHTSSFEIMTFSVDGYVALFSVAFTFYMYSKFAKYNSFNLQNYTLTEYFILLLLFTLLSGQKEIAVIVLFTTIILFTLCCYVEKNGHGGCFPFME